MKFMDKEYSDSAAELKISSLRSWLAQNVEIAAVAAAAASVDIEDLTVDNDLSVSRRCFNDAGLHGDL